MSTPIRKAVARPLTIARAVPTLCYAELFVTLVVGAATLSAIVAVGVLALLHAGSVAYSMYEPDAETVVTEWARQWLERLLGFRWPGYPRSQTRNTWPTDDVLFTA